MPGREAKPGRPETRPSTGPGSRKVPVFRRMFWERTRPSDTPPRLFRAFEKGRPVHRVVSSLDESIRRRGEPARERLFDAAGSYREPPREAARTGPLEFSEPPSGKSWPEAEFGRRPPHGSRSFLPHAFPAFRLSARILFRPLTRLPGPVISFRYNIIFRYFIAAILLYAIFNIYYYIFLYFLLTCSG